MQQGKAVYVNTRHITSIRVTRRLTVTESVKGLILILGSLLHSFHDLKTKGISFVCSVSEILVVIFNTVIRVTFVSSLKN